MFGIKSSKYELVLTQESENHCKNCIEEAQKKH